MEGDESCRNSPSEGVHGTLVRFGVHLVQILVGLVRRARYRSVVIVGYGGAVGAIVGDERGKLLSILVSFMGLGWRDRRPPKKR